MALVTCPDCESQVSDAAPSCPKCGRPLVPATTEQTGKGYKKAQLLGALATIGGCTAFMGGAGGSAHDITALGAVLFLVGLGAFVVGRIAEAAHG